MRSGAEIVDRYMNKSPLVLEAQRRAEEELRNAQRLYEFKARYYTNLAQIGRNVMNAMLRASEEA